MTIELFMIHKHGLRLLVKHRETIVAWLFALFYLILCPRNELQYEYQAIFYPNSVCNLLVPVILMF